MSTTPSHSLGTGAGLSGFTMPEPKNVSVELITPEKAQEYIESGEGFNFRKLDQRRVKEMAADMVAGKWDLNGESLKFDKDNHLIDGQHRCAASILANAPFWTVVFRGASDLNVDKGKPRKFGDYLGYLGLANYRKLASALQLVYLAENHQLNWYASAFPSPTSSQLMSVLERHPLLSNSCQKTHGSRRLLKPSIATFLHYTIMRVKGEESADKWHAALTDGVGLGEKDPLLLLRNRLIVNRASKSKLAHGQLLGLCIVATNAYLQGITSLTILKAQSKNQHGKTLPFPKLIGW